MFAVAGPREGNGHCGRSVLISSPINAHRDGRIVKFEPRKMSMPEFPWSAVASGNLLGKFHMYPQYIFGENGRAWAKAYVEKLEDQLAIRPGTEIAHSLYIEISKHEDNRKANLPHSGVSFAAPSPLQIDVTTSPKLTDAQLS